MSRIPSLWAARWLAVLQVGLITALPCLCPYAARAAEPAPGAKAAEVRQAEVYAAQAFDAYGQKRYALAIELYERAWAAARAADILFNIARVYEIGMLDAKLAVRYYQRYVEHPRSPPERRALAEQRISALRATESPVSFAPATLSAAASRPAPLATPRSGAPVARERAGWTGREWGAVVLAGVGVATLGTGVGFGWSAYASSGEWSRQCDGNLCSSQRAVDAAHAAGRKANVATLLVAIGGGALAGGAALWWLVPGSGPNESGAPRFEPLIGAAHAGGALSGRF